MVNVLASPLANTSVFRSASVHNFVLPYPYPTPQKWFSYNDSLTFLQKVTEVTSVKSQMSRKYFNPLVTNGLSHPYHLAESIFILRDTRCNFSFLFHFSMKIMSADRQATDETPRFAAFHLGIFCLPMSHEKDARLIWVQNIYGRSY